MVVIIEDHPLFANALCDLAKRVIPGCITCIKNRLFNAIEYTKKNSAELIITDLHLADAHGLNILYALENHNPNSLIIALTGDIDLIHAYQQQPGNKPFTILSKRESSEQLQNCIGLKLRQKGIIQSQTTAQQAENKLTLTDENGSSFQLTDKQKKVLQHISEGLSNKEIAKQLSISPETVKTHAKDLYEKLNVKNRTQAANLAKELLELAQPNQL
jgi:DNA-binding NarL/FixJ family response regulator